MRIEITQDGPYRVTGGVPLARQIIVTDEQGQSVRWKQGERYRSPGDYRLCRCGHSCRKPFCDSSHEQVGFDGTEVASRESYLTMSDEQEGPDLTLTDAPSLCAYARFCDADGQIWNLVEASGRQDAIRRAAANCPSGRLVVWDRSGRKPLEPDLPASIGVVEDPAQGVSGPLWVRGRIPLYSADGGKYQARNRVALCRCGASRNKPFCDGTHAAIGFQDEAITEIVRSEPSLEAKQGPG
jgi:CDGSH-type Zn-finger protein